MYCGCTNCGTILDATASFCFNCGVKIDPEKRVLIAKKIGHHPWRRLLARFTDVSILGLILFLLFALLIVYIPYKDTHRINSFILMPLLKEIVIYFLWMPVEALCLSKMGTTPGKWMFGIKVQTKTGKKLSFGSALKRVFKVWVFGDGLCITFVAVATRIISYSKLEKTGTTRWDESVGSEVIYEELDTFRKLAGGVTAAIAIVMTILIIMA